MAKVVQLEEVHEKKPEKDRVAPMIFQVIRKP